MLQTDIIVLCTLVIVILLLLAIVIPSSPSILYNSRTSWQVVGCVKGNRICVRNTDRPTSWQTNLIVSQEGEREIRH